MCGEQSTAPQGEIEVDSNTAASESDSAYGDETESYTTSLSSSITAYRFENGRRYHAYKEGSYAYPNDEAESDRLDMLHHMYLLLLGNKLSLAPISKNVERCLDIGCGTGLWAIDFADRYNSAQVVGIDLSPIQPRWVPPNLEFQVDDIEAEWTFSKPFDFIHSRYMTCSIADWPKLVSQCFKCTTPGGYAEFQDYDLMFRSDDGSLPEDCALKKWITQFIEINKTMGKEPNPGLYLEGWMKDAGYEDVTVVPYKIPAGPWAKDKRLKEIGAYNQTQLLEGVEAFTMALWTRVLQWKPEEVQVFLADIRKDMKNPKIHSYLNFYVVYGKKPTDE